MNSPERHDYLLHQLVSLRDTYALSSLIATGDAGKIAALTDEYLRDATVLMAAAYGRTAADQVRASRPKRTPPAATGVRARLAAAYRELARAAGEAVRRNAEEWHHQTLGLAGPG
jgi:hypothetical protein